MHDAFMDDICANPDDDTPRLVYADWLDENGEPERAEFIRAQIQAYRMPESEERWALVARSFELREAHWDEWFGWLRLPEEQFEAERGFVSHICTHISWLVERGDCPRLPLKALSLHGEHADPQHLADLARCDLSRVTHLSLWDDSDFPAGGPPASTFDDVLALLSRVKLPVLTGLEIYQMRVSLPTLLHQLTGERTPRLCGLSLIHAGITSGDLLRLATWPLLPQLESLRLDGNEIEDGASALRSCELGRLRTLHLPGTAPDAAGLREMLSNPTLSALADLDLSGNALNRFGAATFSAARLPSLSRLSLRNNGLGSGICHALGAWLARQPIKDLDLSQNPMRDPGLYALLEGGAFTGVETLTLFDCGLGDAGARLLCDSAISPRKLTVYGNTFSEAARASLRERFGKVLAPFEEEIPF